MNWKTNRLSKHEPDKYRFKITGVKKETALSYLVQFEDMEHWIPKSLCEIGIEPKGHWYAIDLPEWIAKQKGLA